MCSTSRPAQVVTFAAPRYAAGYRRLREGLSLHHQSRHRHWRRRGHGMACRRGRRQHGVRPVSSDLPLPSQGQILPHQRSGARGGRRARRHRGREFMEKLSSAQVAGAARHRGARHRQRDEAHRGGLCAARHHAQAGAVHQRALPQHLRRPASATASTWPRSRSPWCPPRITNAAAC